MLICFFLGSSSFLRKAKSEYFMSVTTDNRNDPRRFWKANKSMSGNSNVNELPSCVLKDSVAVHEKTEMLNCFNDRIVSSGRLLDSVSSVSVQPCVDDLARAGQTLDFCHSQCRRYIEP
jgi:hypothetical protein